MKNIVIKNCEQANMPKRRVTRTRNKYQTPSGVIVIIETELTEYINDQLKKLGINPEYAADEKYSERLSGALDAHNPFRYFVNEFPGNLRGIKSHLEKGDAILFGITFDFESLEVLGLAGKKTFNMLLHGGVKDVERAKRMIERARLQGKKFPYSKKAPLPKTLAGIRGTGGRKYKFTVADIEFLLLFFEKAMRDQGFQAEIASMVKSSYETYVIPAIKANLPFNLQRGGHSSGTFFKGARNITLTTMYEVLKKVMLRSPTVKPFRAGKTFGVISVPFTINTLKSIRMPKSGSVRNSVYMMLEFGTGHLARYPRFYKSDRRTPWKLPPQVASAFGYSTAAWVTRPSVRRNIIKFAKEYHQSTEGKTTGLTEAQGRRLGKRFSGYDNFIFGKNKQTSIEPYEIFFNKRGIVRNVSKAYKLHLEDINQRFEQLYRQYLVAYGQQKVNIADYTHFLNTVLPVGFLKIKMPETIFDPATYARLIKELERE